MSAEGSLILLLAGLGGILPDTLDFRVARYLGTPDVEIDPDPNEPDPQAIAERVAWAIDRAYKANVPVNVQFHTMRLGADLWRRYGIRFDGGRREVRVRIGPLVSTSQVPYPDSEPDLPIGRARIVASTRYTYESETWVDVFSGPAFEFRRRDDTVEITFLPWHRRWSHSFALVVLLGTVISLVFGPLYGVVLALGSITHILEDQLGYMGSDLAYPFSKRRVKGLRLFHSGDILPNLFTVWSSAVMVMLNVDRFSADPVLDPWGTLVIGLFGPWMAIWAVSWWSRRRRAMRKMSVGDIQRAEVLAEAEEVSS
jgi:membrane-bound metal-dependent hydrolase YbcI (DUF457 family)